MSTFPEAFRQIVIPDLRTFVGLCARSGVRSFKEIFDDAVQIAIRRGGLKLPDDVWHHLLDWIGAEILRKQEESEAEIEALSAANIERYGDRARRQQAWARGWE